MKVKYIGKSFYNGFGLTNGKVYECTDILKDIECLEIIDDELEQCIYSTKKPSAPDDNTKFGKWEIIEDKEKRLQKEFKRLKLI